MSNNSSVLLLNFLIWLCLIVGNLSTLIVPFYIVTKHQYSVIPVRLGTPSKEMNLVLDINGNYTWISSILNSQQLDSIEQSNNKQSIIINRDHCNYSGYLLSDPFEINHIMFESFSYAWINKINPDEYIKYYGAISLGNLISSDSLINRMKNEENILHRSFSLKYTDTYEGIITFGDTISEIIPSEDNSFIAKCSIGLKYSNWNCLLKSIVLGEITIDNKTNKGIINLKGDHPNLIYEINQEAFLETIIDKIVVPKKVFEYIQTAIFHIPLNGNKEDKTHCYIEKNNEEYNEIICPIEDTIYQEMMKMNLVFNDFALSLDNESLLYCNDLFCKYRIVSRAGSYHWQLGSILMKQFDTYYNIDEQSIYFWNNNHQIIHLENHTNNTALHYIRNFCYILMSVALLGISLLLVVLLLKRKNIEKQNNQQKFYKQFNDTKG